MCVDSFFSLFLPRDSFFLSLLPGNTGMEQWETGSDLGASTLTQPRDLRCTFHLVDAAAAVVADFDYFYPELKCCWEPKM